MGLRIAFAWAHRPEETRDCKSQLWCAKVREHQLGNENTILSVISQGILKSREFGLVIAYFVAE
jgi:hypothetical protein